MDRMVARAHARGIGPAVERSVAYIVDRLINDPRGWGDPIRNLRKAGQIEYQGRYNRLLAVYTLHERIPLVFLWRIIPQEGHPLFGENFDV
jgi:hypothetical protein